jgi:hypothetical protein
MIGIAEASSRVGMAKNAPLATASRAGRERSATRMSAFLRIQVVTKICTPTATQLMSV